jgi:hypothetical protein
MKRKGDDLSQYIDQANQAFDAALKGEDQLGMGQKQNINFEYVAPEPIKRPDGTESQVWAKGM